MKEETIKKLILEYLYQNRINQIQFFNDTGVPENFVEFAKQKGFAIERRTDVRVFREAFWALVSKNLVVPGTNAIGGMDRLPWVSITNYGEKCFEESKILPYDPNGFLKSLYSEIPDIDAVTKLYLEEAISCFANMNYLSAVVMVGGALERTIIDLTEKFYKKLKSKKTQFEADILQKEKIKTKFDNFLKFLESENYKSKLDRPLQEKLGSLFPAIVNLIRITRNETGHPTGRDISHDEAEAYILLSKEAIKFSSNLLDRF